ncbi:RsmB/NOP family class I SAM-dependent RNA methyltransferase [Rhizorhapis sp. SPR117]|uniref:RsmB/NOP family class I SAM-dependent RNA methyltransferase n=1 Tax=Rhizorhapis sp. SPR117 TaxID=2912611 RepID=UPI001F305710|nr:methyltransferase domain-containing protein [Rhizorhapis sp. SPR117]
MSLYPAHPAGLPARRAALKLLDAILRRGEPLELALHGATQGLADRADKAFTHAIVAEVLRHMPDLDALIDGATRRVLPPDAKARAVLRLALVQVLVLKTPPHAAISTALPLVDGGPRKLVHGVFGTLMRAGASLPEIPSLLPEVAVRWQEQWGADMVQAAQEALAASPAIDLTLKDSLETDLWCERLGGTSLLPGHVRLAQSGDIASLPGFADGAWWVQDLAASLPARLFGQGDGRHVLDLCAAPGGKTMQLAAHGWRVTSVDQSQKRLVRLDENLARTGLSATTVQADLRQWQPEAPVDAILLDAPCTATGIFRRHPDVLHRIGERQIAELAELQQSLLDRVADWLKPGGVLVFATCSLEQAEGERQIERLLTASDAFALDPVEAEILPAGIVSAAEGWVRTLPSMLAEQGRLDGFFIARLKKTE